MCPGDAAALCVLRFACVLHVLISLYVTDTFASPSSAGRVSVSPTELAVQHAAPHASISSAEVIRQQPDGCLIVLEHITRAPKQKPCSGTNKGKQSRADGDGRCCICMYGRLGNQGRSMIMEVPGVTTQPFPGLSSAHALPVPRYFVSDLRAPAIIKETRDEGAGCRLRCITPSQTKLVRRLFLLVRSCSWLEQGIG